MEPDQRLGRIVVLNGAPRSGKTSIATAIQNTGDGVWMNLGVDGFMSMTPQRYHPGIGLWPGRERPDMEATVARMYYALYDSIAAHSRMGLNVVADLGHHDGYSEPQSILPQCARRLQGLPALLAGIRCPVPVVMERRRATGRNPDLPEPVILEHVVVWEREVHRPGIYDVEFDTSTISPEECADAILRRLTDGPAPSAFRRLAAMAM
jgi:chloramphenicol 3-O phosphotransferase